MPRFSEKKARNRKIYLEKKAGVTWRELMEKYDLSYTRLYYIIQREKEQLEKGKK